MAMAMTETHASTLRCLLQESMDGYARDYLEDTGDCIPAEYIKGEVAKVMQQLPDDEVFMEMYNEDPDVENWELDVYPELICAHSSFYTDYPYEDSF